MNKYTLTTTSGHQCDATTDTLTKTQQQTTINNNVVLSTSTSTTSMTTEPGVCIPPEDLSAIRDAYIMAINMPMTASIAHEIEAALKDGMETCCILDAIQQTGNAPRPSPYYLRAILQRWRRDGILTADKLAADKGRHEQRTAPPWWQKNPALDYEQRKYPPEFYDSLITDLSQYRDTSQS